MNKVILMGRFTRDPEVSYSQGDNQTAIARFTLAVDRRFAGNDGTNADFFNCVTFGKRAEFVEKYFRKGMKALVTGQLQNNNYTNKDGEKVYSVNIVVDDVEFCESKSSSGTADGNRVDTPQDDGFVNVPESIQEELPFA